MNHQEMQLRPAQLRDELWDIMGNEKICIIDMSDDLITVLWLIQPLTANGSPQIKI